MGRRSVRQKQQQQQQVTWSNQCCGPCAFTIWGFLFLVIGGILICMSYIGPQITNYELKTGIYQRILWQSNSDNETKLKFSGRSPSQTGYMKFYFWNITNVEEIKQGEKPNLVEVGPFCYNKYDIRYDVQFDEDGRVYFNDVVYYSEQLLFDDCMHDSTIITTPNTALLGMLESLRHMDIYNFAKDIISNAIVTLDGDLFMERSVNELLWGYVDPVLDVIVKRFGFMAPSLNGMQYIQLVGNHTDIDTSIQKPTTNTMDTGAQNISNISQYVKWENVTEIVSWNNTFERVRGTDAHQFPPGLTKDSVLPVWTSDLYRVAEFEYIESTQFHGIELYRYVPSQSLYQINPDYDQSIYGLLNITVPQAIGPSANRSTTAVLGPQVLVSLPHFCGADPILSENVEGMHCEDAKHQLYLDVEPTMGTTFHALIRLQMSTYVETYGVFDHNVSAAIIPIFWTEQLGEAEPSQIAEFKQGVEFAHTLIYWFARFLVIGVFIASFSIFFFGAIMYNSTKRWISNYRNRRRLVGDYESLQESGRVSLLDKPEDVESGTNMPLAKFIQSFHNRQPSSVQPRTPSESEAELQISTE